MKKKIIILAAFVVTFFTACTSTHMITFSNAELSDKEKDMIENNSNYSTASIVGGSAKLVKEERDKAIQEKIEARRNKLKAIDGLSISSYKDKNGKEQFKATTNNSPSTSEVETLSSLNNQPNPRKKSLSISLVAFLICL